MACTSVENFSKVYQILSIPTVFLRSSPDTSPNVNNIIEDLPATILVRRLDNVVYPDARPGSFIKFYFVSVAPNLTGYVAAFETNSSGTIIPRSNHLVQTIEALLAQEQLRKLEKHSKCQKVCC